MKQLRLFFVIFSFCFFSLTACEKEDISDPVVDYLSVIWDKAPHCAFTDLVEYEGRYYCCFREGWDHIPKSSTEYGRIRILVSLDGTTWSSAAYIDYPDYDIRDPKLCVTTDNRLMLSFGCASILNNSYGFNRTMVSFFSSIAQDGSLVFTSPIPVTIDKKPQLSSLFLWRVVWRKGNAYGIAYMTGQGAYLIESQDGINYNVISRLNFDPECNEADMEFLPNNDLMVVIRSNLGKGYLATSSYPYKQWSSNQLNYRLHCPEIISLRNRQFVAGRGLSGISLYFIDGQNLKEIYTFPAKGDYGYPGLVEVNGQLWMSFYRSNKIYFSKIKISEIFNKANISI